MNSNLISVSAGVPGPGPGVIPTPGATRNRRTQRSPRKRPGKAVRRVNSACCTLNPFVAKSSVEADQVRDISASESPRGAIDMASNVAVGNPVSCEAGFEGEVKGKLREASALPLAWH
jgi:hypothetical protein